MTEARTRQMISPSRALTRAGLVLAATYWLLQAALDAVVFHQGPFSAMLLPAGAHLLIPRLLVLLLLLIIVRVAHALLARRQHEDGAPQSLSEVSFLSRCAMDFIELPLDEDIFQYIGERIKELIGEGVVIINSFDEESDSLRVRVVLGAGELITGAIRALGRHPVGLSFKLTEDARRGITLGKLEKAQGGLYQACFGKINADLCHRIEYLAGVDEVYGVGFARKGGIFGDALIITRKGHPMVNQSVIEALVNQASVALQRRKAEDELRGLTLVDDLTGLYNRRGFLTLAEQQLKIANRMHRRMLLLFADLDYLKWINDTFGHHEGDRAIRDASAIVKRCFRDSDIVSRLGGDEFAVLVVEPGDVPASLFTQRLLNQLDVRNTVDGHDYPLSMSVGIETYDPLNPCGVEELLDLADRRMYEQKRGRVRAVPQM